MNSKCPQDCSTSHWKNFSGVAKALLYLFSGSFWSCCFSKELHFHNFHRLWVFCFRHFVKNFRQHCPNCHLPVLRNKLKNRNASEDLRNFDYHLNWRTKSWAFWLKSSSRAAKNSFFYGWKGTNWEKFSQKENAIFHPFRTFSQTLEEFS